jgi:hypothetical protein
MFMNRLSRFALALATTSLVTSAFANPPTVTHVKNITSLATLLQNKVTTGPDMVVENYLLAAAVDDVHQLKDGVSFSYSLMGVRWAHLQCQEIAVQVDKRPWALAHFTYTNFLEKTVAIEAWIATLTREQLAQWAAAKTIDIRICHNEFPIPVDFMQNIRDFEPALDAQLKGQPAPASASGR